MMTFHLSAEIPKNSGGEGKPFTVWLNTDKLLPTDKISPVNDMVHPLFILDGPWIGDAGYAYSVSYFNRGLDEPFWPDALCAKDTEFRYVGRSYFSNQAMDWGPTPDYEKRFPDWKGELDKL